MKIMKNYFKTVVVLILLPFLGFGQSDFTQSGYASLLVRLSGNIPSESNFTIPQFASVFNLGQASEFVELNDSTFYFSVYSFGPITVNFGIGEKYNNTLILPNHTDTLYVHYRDSLQFETDYRGKYKELYDASEEFFTLFKKGIFSDYFVYEDDDVLNTPEEYKKTMKRKIAFMKEDVAGDLKESMLKNLFLYGSDTFTLNYFFFEKFDNLFSKANEGSLEKDTVRNLSFFQDLITSDFADTMRLISYPTEVLRAWVDNSEIGLPSLKNVSAAEFLEDAKGKLEDVFDEGGNLFFDLLLATAYLEQIAENQELSAQQRFEVIQSFSNPYLSTYILHQNDLVNEKNDLVFYLPYGEERADVLAELLSAYSGKVVLLDFWATWCGPCIEAFDKVREVKEKYGDNQEVVFVYLADVSSPKEKWKSYTDVIEGEHYYLYRHQMAEIQKEYDVQSLPTYVLIGKDGEVAEKSMNGYMGNDTLVSWIEKALDEE